MNPSVRSSLRSISLILLLMLLPGSLKGQSLFPAADGERVRLSCQIEMDRGYISGLCILYREGDEVRGSIFNEFGLSAADFTYYPSRQKVKLHTVISMLDKWYIRRVLRRDLCLVMHGLQDGKTTYENLRRHITYTFVPTVEGKDDR